jgi:hypothetical protein
VRMWMPSAGMVQPVARAMVVVGAAICGRGGDVSGAGDVGGTGDVGVTGDARSTAASGAVSGASIAPAVAQAVIAARSESVMLG